MKMNLILSKSEIAKFSYKNSEEMIRTFKELKELDAVCTVIKASAY